MPNVGHSTLSSISKNLLNTHREQRFYSTRLIKSLIHVCNTSDSQCIVQNISFAQLLIFQKRYLSIKDDAKSNKTAKDSQKQSKQKQSFSSESAYYRQQARNSYERKRTNQNNKSRTNEQHQDKSSSLISNDINHYQRLNINQDADISTIKSAYYSLSKMYHPDIVGLDDKLAAENFRLVTESYDVLSDPVRKATYDKELDMVSRQNDLYDIFMRSSSRHPDKDFTLNFRSRNSDVIFRTMQDAALEREKLKNPTKFRAGVFERSYEENEEKERLRSLSRRLIHFKPESGKSANMDGSDFYKMHLFDTIHRRHNDMILNAKHYGSDKNHTHLSENDATTLIFSLGAAFIGLVVVIMSFFDMDPAVALDDKLVGYMQKKKDGSSEAENSSRYS